VLLGALSPLRGIGPEELAIDGLLARLDGVAEVILATNPNVEGEATAHYLARLAQAARRARHPPGVRHAGRRRHRVHRRGDAVALAARPAGDVARAAAPASRRRREPAARRSLAAHHVAAARSARAAAGGRPSPPSKAPGVNTVGGGPSPLWREARGANVLDVDGNRYVDLTSGFGVALVGHRHPAVVAAVRRQASRLLHGFGDVHAHPARVALAAALGGAGADGGCRRLLRGVGLGRGGGGAQDGRARQRQARRARVFGAPTTA
jgi:hypothetical protein